MAGVGEASAIISIVQLGFSLSRAIETYVTGVREAEEDILEIGNQLETTSRHLKALSKLIEGNGKTRGWDENGLALARNCVNDCEKTTKKLRGLLVKSGATLLEDVQSEDLDLSKLTKAKWPVYKPQFVVLKQELVFARINILLAQNTYMVTVGVSKAKKRQAYRSLAALSRRQKKAEKVLQRTKERLDKSEREGSRSRARSRSRRRHPTRSTATSSSDSGGRGRSSDPDSSSRSTASSWVPRQRQESLERRLRLQIRLDNERQEAEVSQKASLLRKTEEDAVQKYKDDVLAAAEHHRALVEDSERKLAQMKELSLSENQIKKIVGQLHDTQNDADLTKLITGVTTNPNAGRSSSALDIKPEDNITGLRKILKRLGKSQKDMKLPVSGADPIPLVLQDTTNPDRYAVTKTLIVNHNGMGHYNVVEAATPIAMLTRRLRWEETAKSKELMSNLQAWKAYADLPYSCAQYIQAHLQTSSERDGRIWTLLFVDKFSAAPRWRNRGTMGPSTSVIVVLKRSDASSAVPPRNQDTAVEYPSHLPAQLVVPGTAFPYSNSLEQPSRLSRINPQVSDVPQVKLPAQAQASGLSAVIKFKDAIGRNFTFPWESCRTWKGMESLINAAFLHVDIIGSHVMQGYYDLLGPERNIILPQVWEEIVQPNWEVSMEMWPLPEPAVTRPPNVPPLDSFQSAKMKPRGKSAAHTRGDDVPFAASMQNSRPPHDSYGPPFPPIKDTLISSATTGPPALPAAPPSFPASYAAPIIPPNPFAPRTDFSYPPMLPPPPPPQTYGPYESGFNDRSYDPYTSRYPLYSRTSAAPRFMSGLGKVVDTPGRSRRGKSLKSYVSRRKHSTRQEPERLYDDSDESWSRTRHSRARFRSRDSSIYANSISGSEDQDDELVRLEVMERYTGRSTIGEDTRVVSRGHESEPAVITGETSDRDAVSTSGVDEVRPAINGVEIETDEEDA